MIQVIKQVGARLNEAVQSAYGKDADGIETKIVPSNNANFGDYQSNLALTLSKPLKQSPRAIAETIIKKVDLSDLCETPEIAGPGFINLRVKKNYIEAELNKLKTDARLGISLVKKAKKVLVEYSSINIAKEMHVGHLRGTIIGHCLANVYEFQGHKVTRVSHVGDWGTQFGMLIAYLKQSCPEAIANPGSVDLGDVETFYKKAKTKFDQDDNFKDISRAEVVRLQSGEADSLRAWQALCEQSRREADVIYKRLEVAGLIERGESIYNPILPQIVEDLRKLGLAVEDQGAVCVFLEGFTNEQGQPLPLIVQKRGGGFNYDTTDLAAIRSRLLIDKEDWLIYVVDASQSDHFAQFFQVARRADWIPADRRVVHVAYGVVQGADGKKLKTRSGESVKLKDLLDEAVTRAKAELESRLTKDDRKESADFISAVADKIAMGAIKYADLSLNRMTNYVFDFDKMLSLQGNTAPYMMYAYVRVRGIGRKANIDIEQLVKTANMQLTEEYEYDLGKHLFRFDEIIEAVAEEYMPNRICDYLFELSQKFNQFYENCPVLSASDDIKNSRLLLCDLTARTIKLGLALLGISVPERM